MLKLKQYYLNFLEKEKRNLGEIVFYGFLCLLSYIYWLVVALRNFLYQSNILPVYTPIKPVVSVGNISWGGGGKTSLVIWLEKRLSQKLKVAILRRGYGRDEGLLLKENSEHVYSSRNRVQLVKGLDSQFEAFILDDGFQYRKLKAKVNIVVIGACEFRRTRRLIPADCFREPINSLARADIILVNHSDELDNRDKATREIKRFSPNSKLYFSQYRIKRFVDLDSKIVDLASLSNKKIAAFTAIGYPQGFFRKLKQVGLNPLREIAYLDHYELSVNEYSKLEVNLLSQGVTTLVISAKDKYHLPAGPKKLNIVVMEVEIEIENKEAFLTDIQTRI